MTVDDSSLGLPDPARWEQINLLLDELLELPSEQREERLASLSSDDPAMGALVGRLLGCATNDQALDKALQPALGFLATSDSLPAQRDFGPWRLVSPLGQGGMAQVFLAERADGAYEQKAAIKLMWPWLAIPEELARFQHERQLLATLDDPRIARLLDGGMTSDGRPWLAMEYVQGMAITTYCDQQGLSPDARLELFCEVVAAIGSAHRQLVVHGDIKPGNVMVTETGSVRLLDFGIGRLLREGPNPPGGQGGGASPRALTPNYASPEQRSGLPVTTASDIYQLGRLLEDLFPGTTSREREIRAIIGCASASDPDGRYQGAQALIQDIRRLLSGRAVAACAGGRFYRTWCFLRRRRLSVLAWSLMGVLLIAGMVMFVEQSRRVAAEAEISAAVLGFLEGILYGGDPYATDERSRIPIGVIEDAGRRAAVELQAQPQVHARVLTVLGQVYLARGENEAARQLLEQARLLEPGSALTRGALGVTYGHMGMLEEGEALLRMVLEDRQARHGHAHPLVAETLLKLADLLHSRGMYEEAAGYATQALDSGHHLAWAQRELGMIRRDQGRYPEAEAHLLAAMEEDRKVLGPLHVNLAATLEHLGQLMLMMGHQVAAEEALHQALEIRQHNLGPGGDGLLWTHQWLGLAAYNRGELVQAEELLSNSLADLSGAFSTNSQIVAYAAANLGWVHLASGDLSMAVARFEESVSVLEQTRPGGHPRLGEPWMGLAVAALLAGDKDQARDLAHRALEHRRAMFGAVDPVHPLIVSACMVYRAAGAACPEQGALAPESLEYRRVWPVLEAFEARFGPPAPAESVEGLAAGVTKSG